MIILIDAYNLLKTVLHVQFVSDFQRDKFLKFFEKYAQKRPQNKIILIFDGGVDVYEYEGDYQHISLVYAGCAQSADDVIKKKIVQLQGYDTLLVTCDRELRKYAESYQMESLGSVEFYKIVESIVFVEEKQEISRVKSICKTSLEKNIELDVLMEMGSRNLVVKDQDKIIKVTIKPQVQTTHKKDKKLLKKIVKI